VREAYRLLALGGGKTNHQAPGSRRKGYLSPLRYVQSGYKVETGQVSRARGAKTEYGKLLPHAHHPGVRYERVRQLSIGYDKLSGRWKPI
jgi:putative transposase